MGRIVETEAYAGPEDLASHARFGSPTRNAVMAGPPGIAYVYLVYGMYDCLNVVTGPTGRPGAVLIRAVEPLTGMEIMRAGRLAVGGHRRAGRRGTGSTMDAAERLMRVPDHALARGPGLVGACFGVDRSWTGTDLCAPDSPLHLEAGGTVGAGAQPGRIVAGPRVGVGYAGAPWDTVPWRFALDGHASVSRPR